VPQLPSNIVPFDTSPSSSPLRQSVSTPRTPVNRNQPVNWWETDEWRFIADRKIREAMEEGAFDRLEGAGKPLDLNENPFEDPSLRMAHRLLRNNGFAPAWIEESRDIDTEIRYLKTNAQRLEESERRQRITLLNRRIAAYNLKTPVLSAHKLPL
jgi:hypothetical protein